MGKETRDTGSFHCTEFERKIALAESECKLSIVFDGPTLSTLWPVEQTLPSVLDGDW